MVMRKKAKGRTALICDDCEVEIFVNVNMIMVHDELWKKIISLPPKTLIVDDALCDCCMEKRLARPITRKDWFKPMSHPDDFSDSAFPPCNVWSEKYRLENP